MTSVFSRGRIAHQQVVLDYYADRENIAVAHTDTQRLYDMYLSKVMELEEIGGKRILEIGAGCSQYIPLFLQQGCEAYFGNDLIPERLERTRVTDPRYHELPGDFLAVNLPKQVDLVFANLTMVCVKPLFANFAEKIFDSLKRGGIFLSMEVNFFCPLNFVRNWLEKGSPAMPFSPFAYAKVFEQHGFVIEKLVPFTGPYPWTTGIWPLGTAFWMRARKL